MPQAQLGGVRLKYSLRGPKHAPVLMFSNSLGTNLDMWQPQVAAFTTDWRVLTYDTRGHGASEVTPAPYTLNLLARDAIGLLDHLNIETVHFCGLSLGGLTGQALALAWPQRLASLTLANTAAHIPPAELWNQRINTVRQLGLEAIVDNVLARWFTDGFAASAPDIWSQMRTMFCGLDPQGYMACCMAVRDADFRNDIECIHIPTLVICGQDDLATPPALSEFLANTIPEAHLAPIKHAAHISSLEQADIFNHHLRTFLNRTIA